MGHRTLAMTLRYSHISPGHRLDAVQRLNPPTDAARSDTGTDTSETTPEAVAAAGAEVVDLAGRFEWRRAESNRGPRDYETLALAN